MKPLTFLISLMLTASVLFLVIYKFFVSTGNQALIILGFAIWFFFMVAAAVLGRRFKMAHRAENPEIKEPSKASDDDFDF